MVRLYISYIPLKYLADPLSVTPSRPHQSMIIDN